MKCDRYIERFKVLGDRLEETYLFKINESKDNCSYAGQLADKIESELKKYEEEFVGLDYTRNGLVFDIRITAYNREGHMDKFHRIQTLFLDHDSFEPIRQIGD